jgi:hypothetical protein
MIEKNAGSDSSGQSQGPKDQQRQAGAQTPPPTNPRPREKDVKPLTSDKPTGE